ncbi:hypothetical protein HG536_0C04370 [Torulaspora globosa]|uniref:Regulator of rDNA transcription protein 5 n=1 Tax=Torulaspora globosa TaxID=48254 RepID=A0A7G3ZFI2_9SACH|nr:uncharacterized protein HG536_0C04370 [Torulaspora globosa]QLL32268.1 hypothetical protein HG536_0C04370 [Torulaspora globosa]
MSSTECTRLYISNLNFSSDETELFDYFKDYGVVSVLIPSQTVRGFRNNHIRPLGIAYAEFESSEKLKEAVDNLNGKAFKGRELRLKPYVPYSPTNVNKRLKRRNHLLRFRLNIPAKEKELAPSTDPVSIVSVSHQQNEPELLSDEEKAMADVIQESEFSEDTVYCGYLPKGVTDTDLREYFKDFNPQEIWIFRTKLTRSKHFQIHRHLTAALVSFETDADSRQISESLQKKKLLGKRIVIKPAYQAKIEELKQLSKDKVIAEKEIVEQSPEQPESDKNMDE